MISFLLPIVILASGARPGGALGVMSRPSSADYKVVGYYPSWNPVNRGWGGQAKDIDPNLLTHVIYAHAVLDNILLEIKPAHPQDEATGFKSITNLKERDPKLKVLLSLGGPKDSTDQSGKYERLMKSFVSRAHFIVKTVECLKKHNFDGLDVDFRNPTPREKATFATFIKELYEVFQENNLQLFVTVSAHSATIDSAYDIPNLNRHSDFIIVWTYNYTVGRSKTTQLSAPTDAVETSIKHWISKGAHSNKLLVGIPFYGKTYTLKNANQHGLNAQVSGPGVAGPFSKQKGYLSFYEICSEKGWITKNTTTGSYAYKAKKWVSYDDPKTVEIKAKYIKNKRLGGAALWNLLEDDFRGVCCEVKHPLQNVVSSVLLGKGKSAASLSW